MRVVLLHATGLTGVPGVWAAGNVTDLLAQVVNGDLIADDIQRAVTGYREQA